MKKVILLVVFFSVFSTGFTQFSHAKNKFQECYDTNNLPSGVSDKLNLLGGGDGSVPFPWALDQLWENIEGVWKAYHLEEKGQITKTEEPVYFVFKKIRARGGLRVQVAIIDSLEDPEVIANTIGVASSKNEFKTAIYMNGTSYMLKLKAYRKNGHTVLGLSARPQNRCGEGLRKYVLRRMIKENK